MKIIFFGTSYFSARILEFLLKSKFDIVAIVSKDVKKNKNDSLSVKEVLKEQSKIPLFLPDNIRDESFINEIKKIGPDIFLVVAYGKILPKVLLNIPKKMSINIHASLLPKYRGASPIRRAIMNSEKETGITIMEMTENMDAGAILKIGKIKIFNDMNFLDVRDLLIEKSKKLLLDLLNELKENKEIKKTFQDSNFITYANKILSKDTHINWSENSKKIYDLVRALAPFPGAESILSINGNQKKIKIKQCEIFESTNHNKPGEIIIFKNDLFVVACKDKSIKILQVQLEGKKTLLVKDFINGMKDKKIFFLNK